MVAAKAAAEYADAEFQRQYTLSQTTQFGWQSKFYEAQKNRDETRANLQKAQAALELAKIELGYTKVTAPFDGIVTTHLAAVGALVGGGSSPTPLATILRLDPIYVTANLSEQDVLRIISRSERHQHRRSGQDPDRTGADGQYRLSAQRRHRLHRAAGRSLDRDAAGARLFANPDYALLPGLFAHVRVSPSQGPEQEALLVPETALGSDQAGRYVLVVDNDNVVDKRSVTVGPAVDELRVIEKGLAPEDRVIVAGLLRAVPGQKVRPETVASAAPSKRADAAR